MPDKPRIWLMLLPALLIVVLLFLGGVVLGLLQSLNYMPLIGNHDFNLKAYETILSDQDFLSAFAMTMYVSVVSTLLSVVLAIMAALVLRETFVGKKLGLFLFQLNLPIPHIVGTIALIMMLTQSGFLSRVLYHTGLIDGASQFPELVFDQWGFGIILSYVWKEVPFIGIAILAVLQTTAGAYEDQARSLGANAWQRFWNVLLPLMFPAILSTSILVFAFVFGTFEIPYMIGGNYPATLPVLAYKSYTDVDLNSRPLAMAMSVIITVIITALILAYSKVTRMYIRQERGG